MPNDDSEIRPGDDVLPPSEDVVRPSEDDDVGLPSEDDDVVRPSNDDDDPDMVAISENSAFRSSCQSLLSRNSSLRSGNHGE